MMYSIEEEPTTNLPHIIRSLLGSEIGGETRGYSAGH